jgi:hypothetical protein
MSFTKTGMLKTAKVEILTSVESWNEIKKQAKVLPVAIEDKSKEAADKEAVEKEADFQVVATINPEKFIYIHSTIMAGVNTEPNGFWVTAESDKFTNDNNDAWTCPDLLTDYKSFKRATTFVEHDQRLENAKGKCIDVIARDMGDTILIDVLFSVDRRHKDLVANIENEIINAVSMGCTTARTVCSICGNTASDPNGYCDHLKPGNKGRQFRCSDGKNRRAAEICKNNTFFDVSLVANPAFAGAIFRKILSSSEISNHLLANILNSRIEAIYQDDKLMLKAASKDSDIANISIKSNGTIEINTPTQKYTANETLSKDEVDKISSFIAKKEDRNESVLDKVMNKIFGKQALHPIQNPSGRKDFTISYEDYRDIPSDGTISRLDGHNRAQVGTIPLKEQVQNIGTCPTLELNVPQNIVLEILPISNKEEVSRVDEFECLKCGFQSELWKVKAASIDAAQENILECPRCFFATESSLFKSAKRKFKMKEKVKVVSKKDKGLEGEIVAFRGPLYIVKTPKKTIRKTEKELEKVEKKASVFIASKNIPVENDEGTYWFDQQGNSVITQGEKVSFVTTVENGEFGLFTTSKGEDFFMPMAYVNSKKIKD